MESNWKWNVFASGLTPWGYGPLGPALGTFVRLARLNTPFYVGPFLIGAVYQSIANGISFIGGTVLREGTYPEGTFPLGVAPNTPFPGPFSVVPDQPAVEW